MEGPSVVEESGPLRRRSKALLLGVSYGLFRVPARTREVFPRRKQTPQLPSYFKPLAAVENHAIDAMVSEFGRYKLQKEDPWVKRIRRINVHQILEPSSYTSEAEGEFGVVLFRCGQDVFRRPGVVVAVRQQDAIVRELDTEPAFTS